jgi:hypothetical protein
MIRAPSSCRPPVARSIEMLATTVILNPVPITDRTSAFGVSLRLAEY